jgi:hypothetical protein
VFYEIIVAAGKLIDKSQQRPFLCGSLPYLPAVETTIASLAFSITVEICTDACAYPLDPYVELLFLGVL